MPRTYSRRARWQANIAINIPIMLAFSLATGESQLFVLGEILLLTPCILYYGYYIASLCCTRCGQSYVYLPENYAARRIAMLLSSVHAPDQCPHCGAKAP